jgi:hypothetical protein
MARLRRQRNLLARGESDSHFIVILVLWVGQNAHVAGRQGHARREAQKSLDQVSRLDKSGWDYSWASLEGGPERHPVCCRGKDNST